MWLLHNVHYQQNEETQAEGETFQGENIRNA
jgi:hypothetical protein